jgi:hypothetical protein
MRLSEIIQELNLITLTEPEGYLNTSPSGGYASDLLSCVMTGAPHAGIWITLQAHANVVAVAALLDLCAVIITEGAMPEPATIAKAKEQNIPLFSTPESSYYIAGKLWEMGLRVTKP